MYEKAYFFPLDDANFLTEYNFIACFGQCGCHYFCSILSFYFLFLWFLLLFTDLWFKLQAY